MGGKNRATDIQWEKSHLALVFFDKGNRIVDRHCSYTVGYCVKRIYPALT